MRLMKNSLSCLNNCNWWEAGKENPKKENLKNLQNTKNLEGLKSINQEELEDPDEVLEDK